MRTRFVSAATVVVLAMAGPAGAMTRHEANNAVITVLGLLPNAAFEKLTEAELELFIEVMPDVADALDDADFDIEDTDIEGKFALSILIDGLVEVDGVEQALEDHGTDWEEFRPTLYRVLVTTGAMVEEVAAELITAFVGAITGQEEMPSEDELDELSLSRKVPPENMELLEKYEDELDGLGEFFE